MDMQEYEPYMIRAIELAELGNGTTSPNPMVGAVIVKDGKIVGEGYHKMAGSPHAEVNAIAAAGDGAYSGTMVVTLEPCNHTGRTPPCTEAIIKAGIRRVIVGMIDPNPKCAGSGIKRLRDAGIEVEYGLLSEEIERQNEAFIKYITTGRPFVILKIALSMDGKIAAKPKQATTISGEESHNRVHLMRNQYDAVMVGIGTVLSDNPMLTTRIEEKETKNPIRIVVDSKARLPFHSKIAASAKTVKTILATTTHAMHNNLEDLKLTGIEVLQTDTWDGSVDLEAVFEELGTRDISSIMVEGGGTLAASLAAMHLIDKYVFFVSPQLIGEQGVDMIGKQFQQAERFRFDRIERIGEDLMIEAYPV